MGTDQNILNYHQITPDLVEQYSKKDIMSLFVRKSVFGVSDTNRAVQPPKMPRGLKFRI